ncbi:mycoredoxin [Nonomuraea sp. NEAU-A123]|nr:mycoredoxin [Nonomuraea sp. NEAU-A123]
MIVANQPRRDRATSHALADRTGMVIYWRPGCKYCMRLRMRLRFTPLRYTEVNIWKDPEAAAFVRSVANGNETVPTVTVAEKAMVNPSKAQVLEAVERYAPHLARK